MIWSGGSDGVVYAVRACLVGCALALTLVVSADAASGEEPRSPIRFNESEIAALSQSAVDPARPLDVLRYVLAAAGDEITVYPSEGYFYFQFQNGPQRILGNIRFDLYDAAEGRLNFGYYAPVAYGAERVDHFSLLSASDSVGLVAVSPFEYNLSFDGRTTRVRIHDAREELAGPKPLAPGESYVGPVFDESGVRLHLLFDEIENAFFFVLNETPPPADTYSDLPGVERLQMGDRTAFAFYEDAARERRILVGVSYANVRSNSYFDGPFDQLPDRFVPPEHMRDLIVRAFPDLAGRVGSRGVYLGAEHMRAMVAPYRQYAAATELLELSACDALAEDNHALTRCLQDFAYRW